MVRVIANLRNHKGELAEQLGMSLGEGLSTGLNTYFANRSLDSVLQDKGLEGASQSKKVEALRSALAPYGETGQQIFQQRLAIQQQEMNEQKNRAVGRYLEGEKLTPEEQSSLSPQEFASIYKAKHPTTPGGVTAQSVPPDVNQKIGAILGQSQGLSADQLKNEMDSAGIPPIYSNGYVENRRRSEETGSKQDLDLHKESEKFEAELRKHAETARRQIPIIERNKKAVAEGKINPGSLANIFRGLGETGKKISDALLSGSEASLLASIPDFLEGRKELFGVRLSDADLKLLEDKLPSISKNKEANLAILDLMQRAAERSLKLEQIAEDVLERKGVPFRSGKLRHLGFERDVMKAFNDQEGNRGGSKRSLQEIAQSVGQ